MVGLWPHFTNSQSRHGQQFILYICNDPDIKEDYDVALPALWPSVLMRQYRFLAMRQLSAPPTCLRSLETERLSSPCLCVRQLSTRLSQTSTGKATNFNRWATREPSLAWTRVFGGNWAAFWLMHNEMRIQDCPTIIPQPSKFRKVLHYFLHGGGCLPRARFDFLLSGTF